MPRVWGAGVHALTQPGTAFGFDTETSNTGLAPETRNMRTPSGRFPGLH
jgi:hypothetical protein